MSSAKITLYGMYRYMHDMHTLDSSNPELFDSLQLPDGVDRDLFIYNTIDRGGEFEVIYPDPGTLYSKVHYWSLKWQRTFKKWIAALDIDYDPLYNYDRTEEETRTPDLTDKRTPDLTHERTADLTTERTADLTDERTADLTTERTPDLESKRTADLTDERTADLTDERTADLTDERTADLTDEETPNTTKTLNGSRTEEKELSAYDSSSYQPAEKLTVTDNAHTEALTGTNTTTHTGTDTTTHTGTDTTTHTGTDTTTHTGTDTTTETGKDTTTETGTDTTTHTGTDTTTETGTDTTTETGTDTTTHTGTEKWNRRAYGNIGVTTSQQMLEAELTISEWNLIDHMSDIFIREFCIPVYV